MSKKIKLPSISKVKKALHDDWSLRVKQRDGWKCLLCGGEELLTAHHWYFTSQRGHAARYCVDNGASLCFTCHIREVHENPGWATVDAVRRAVIAKSPDFDEKNIRNLSFVDLTTTVIRSMWDAMRSRPVEIGATGWQVKETGKKLFLSVFRPHPLAVVGNTMNVPGKGICEVLVASRIDDGYRYTLGQLVHQTRSALPAKV